VNAAELLDQFVLEAREGLEAIGQRLLEVERDPTRAELLNDLFRQVHTLKGNCGLFEFQALERVVHAGEDLLDQVRSGQLRYGDDIADALLAAMDFTAEMIDAIAQQGRLPDNANGPSQALAQRLRSLLPGAQATRAQPHTETSATAPVVAPDTWQIRYRPEPECFFKGEDPWHLACTAPGLMDLQVEPQQPWPDASSFDCYRCNLLLLLTCSASRSALEEHFRYVPEQLEWAAIPAEPAAAPRLSPAADALLQARRQALWQLQVEMLSRPAAGAGAADAGRRVLQALLATAPEADAALVASPRHEAQHGLEQAPTAQPAALAAWAQRHAMVGGPASSPDRLHPPAAAQGVAATGPTSLAPPSPPQPPGTASTTADDPGGGSAPKVLKVAQDKIDRLMELIGEMVVAKNALPYLAQRAEAVYHQRELAREIKAQQAVINRIAEDMQHAIMQVRMQPVGAVFQRFGRLVRDISKKLGKQVNLVVEGEDTEADKNVIEGLADPLIHILRNSLDHGLELPEVRLAAGKPAHGTLRVVARQEGDRVVLDIGDDGAGVDTDRVRAKAVERGLIPAERAAQLTDAEAVQLVFLPGFSTAERISDLSGRGVGMDVVRTAVERVNGTVELRSVRGKGTTVHLTLPLSMAVTNVMMIEAGQRRFGVPMDLVVETVRVHADDIHHFQRARTTVLRGRIVPLRSLHELLALDEQPLLNDDGEHAVLVVRHGSESVGLLVDQFLGASDIILKPLEGVLAGITAFAGTALMGDGSVLMVLNPKEIL
jgi:two-component system chemotaxis sensor kinase CheA